MKRNKKRLAAPKTVGEKIADVLYWIMRIGIIANVVMLFFPAFNPIRVSENVNKNMSLFSCALSHESMLNTFKATLRRQEWLEPAFQSLSVIGVFIIIAIIIASISKCERSLKYLRSAGYSYSLGIVLSVR